VKQIGRLRPASLTFGAEELLRAMTPQPLYTAETLHAPAYELRYAWSGWPSANLFPSTLCGEFWDQLDAAWERDGLRRLEVRCEPACWQLLMSTKPCVSPITLAARVKGRLQHALRLIGQPVEFSRKVAVRSVGHNRTDEVEAYVQNQVANSDYVDPRFKAFLGQFQIVDETVDMSQPTATRSGRYWYDLHLVLTARQRCPITSSEALSTLRDCSLAIARKKGHRLSRLAVMPDHWHGCLRGNIEQSPEEIALAFLNNLAYALGQNAIWQCGYYAGTFGEYEMNAVRRLADDSSS
jgi:REP element-mobilizing transposase RayT